MASPKKKLPTGPLRIEHPKSLLTDTSDSQTSAQMDSQASRVSAVIQESEKQDSSVQEIILLESSKVNTSSQDLKEPPFPPAKPESTKQDSSTQEISLFESSKVNTSSQDLKEPPFPPAKPESTKQDSSVQENRLIESGKPNTSSQDLNSATSPAAKQESIKPDSSLEEISFIESGKPNTSSQDLNSAASPAVQPESRKQDYSIQENNLEESSNVNTSSQDLVERHQPETVVENAGLPASFTESSFLAEEKQESGIESIEYKKVAMRLSKEAVNKLRELRTTTELPYEILVDVMIRNWDNLPAKIQKHYLSEARRSRVQRLIAGQDKAMKTVRSKLLD